MQLTVPLVEGVFYLDEVVRRLPIIVATIVVLLAILVVILVLWETETNSDDSHGR